MTGDDEDRSDSAKTLQQTQTISMIAGCSINVRGRWRGGGGGGVFQSTVLRTSAQLVFRTRLGAGFLESARETAAMVAEPENHGLEKKTKE